MFMSSEFKFYVYCLTNLNNQKRYFGKGSGKRAWDHFADARSVNNCRSLIAKAIRKHGDQNFRLTFIAEQLTSDEALEFEAAMIKRYQTNIRRTYGSGGLGIVYNMDDGGKNNQGGVFSAETCENIRRAAKAKPAFTDTHKLNLSLAHKGQKAWNKGKKTPMVTLQKISKSRKGKHNPKYQFVINNIETIKIRIESGETRKSIAKELKIDYNYFTTIIKSHT